MLLSGLESLLLADLSKNLRDIGRSRGRRTHIPAEQRRISQILPHIRLRDIAAEQGQQGNNLAQREERGTVIQATATELSQTDSNLC